jgi:hypothetical protein
MGDFTAAAEAWAARGCPYESVRALADSQDIDVLRSALRTLQLGANPMGARDSPWTPPRHAGKTPLV